MGHGIRWTLISLLVTILAVVPFYYYRGVYAHSKRLRVVDPGRVYRSGQLTEEGFADVVRRLGIRTILNLQDDYPDPDIRLGYWKRGSIKESAMCAKLGVRYVLIEPDLISRTRVPAERPAAIEQFLHIMDDPDNYPVLIHCKAGLHRTGVLSAVYRMEYQGWTRAQAYAELKAHGFGDTYCTIANDYVKQYVLTYEPGQRRGSGGLSTASR
jgi:protein tyrosine/serine phosphatase